jgi:FAD/FMN-containing dehydrogenase
MTIPSLSSQADDALRALSGTFTGRLIRPTDRDYDAHRRIWNGSISRRPALIARCETPSDVVAALGAAVENGLTVAVRSGGHSFPGHSVCDDGMVIDLGAMKDIRIDADKGTVTAQAGVLLGELDAATQQVGMAVPAGIVTHTGMAGLTLGGGIGWLMRKYGLTVDQLLTARVVTASGEVVRAGEMENADLFWGIRGGGGNFGVVTEFTFRLNPLPTTVLAGPIFWRMADSPRVLRFYRDWIAEAPDDLMTIIVHRKAPNLPLIPAEMRGELVVAVICCWAGPLDQGERVIAPLRNLRGVVVDACQPKPFLEHQAMFDPSFPQGNWYYMRACDVAELSDEVIDITVEHSLRIRSPLTAFPIWQKGGASARIDESSTAFHGRAPGHTFNITASTASAEGFAEEREWSQGLWQALAPYHQDTVYVNFLMDEGDARVRQAYGGERLDRLTALKRKYDPANVLSLNQNIAPD